MLDVNNFSVGTNVGTESPLLMSLNSTSGHLKCLLFPLFVSMDVIFFLSINSFDLM